MMPFWRKLDKLHKTIPGYLFFFVLELAITYGFISLAIDKGNLLYYLLALIFLIGVLENLFGFIRLTFRKVANREQSAKTRRH